MTIWLILTSKGLKPGDDVETDRIAVRPKSNAAHDIGDAIAAAIEANWCLQVGDIVTVTEE
jgi:hypothetical protein